MNVEHPTIGGYRIGDMEVVAEVLDEDQTRPANLEVGQAYEILGEGGVYTHGVDDGWEHDEETFDAE